MGVSNYSLAQIDELERATGQLPAVNQIEWSPALFDEEILLGHHQRGVQPRRRYEEARAIHHDATISNIILLDGAAC